MKDIHLKRKCSGVAFRYFDNSRILRSKKHLTGAMRSFETPSLRLFPSILLDLKAVNATLPTGSHLVVRREFLNAYTMAIQLIKEGSNFNFNTGVASCM